MKIQLISILTMLMWSQVYGAKNQLYRIYDIGESLGKDHCETKAKEVADNIAALTFVKVKGSICETSNSIKTKNIIISYESEEPLQIVSTYTFNDTYVDKGTYKTEQECLENIEQDKKTFMDQTGLNPFLSFCSSSKFSKDNPWFSYIEAFGTSSLIPARSEWKTGRPYGLTKGQIFEDVKNRLEKYGAALEHLNWGWSFSGASASLFYYIKADQPKIHFHTEKISSVYGLSQCINKSETLKSEIIVKDSFPLITSYCSSNYSNPRTFDLEIISLGFNYIQLYDSEETFTSDEQCELSRTEIEEKYESIHGDKIIGSTCEKKQNGASVFHKVIIIRTF